MLSVLGGVVIIVFPVNVDAEQDYPVLGFKMLRIQGVMV